MVFDIDVRDIYFVERVYTVYMKKVNDYSCCIAYMYRIILLKRYNLIYKIDIIKNQV